MDINEILEIAPYSLSKEQKADGDFFFFFHLDMKIM